MTHITAQQAYDELVRLRDVSGTNIFERLKLADRLLSDHLWVAAKQGGGGDESKAIDKLEEEAFGDLCGSMTLPEMLELLKAFPQVSTWKQNKFNLRKMHTNLKTRNKRTPEPREAREPRTAEERLRVALQEKAALLREMSELKRENRRLHSAVSNLQKALNALQFAEA